MTEEPKEIGTYSVQVNFHADVTETLTIDLVKE